MDTVQYKPSRISREGIVSASLGTCQEQLKIALEVYSDSLKEADVVKSYIEGKHYSRQTLIELREAGRAPEAYNLILRVKRLLVGYITKVVTTVIGNAVTLEDTVTANLHNDNFKLTQRLSKWESVISSIVEDVVVTGLGAWGIKIIDTKRRDVLDRPIMDIKLFHIASSQVLPDPRAVLPDKSDGKFIHQWEYLSYDEIVEEFGQSKADSMREYHSNAETGDWLNYSTSYLYNNLNRFEYWKDGETFFIVRTYRKEKELDEDTGVKEEVITMTSWHGDMELSKTTLDVEMFPIGAIDVQRKSENNRYYSILYEAVPSQDAINQALLKFQNLVGAHRILADKRAVSSDEVDSFNKKIKTIDEVLHIKDIRGIKIERLTGEAKAHIEKMYTSIELIMQVIGINEAFLGESKAGDSGRKFEGQRSASENTLQYLTTPINLIYEQMYIQVVHFASVYKQAEETVRFEDEFGQTRWVMINQPFLMPTGEVDSEGKPIVEPVRQMKKNKSNGMWQVQYINERAKSLSQIAVEVDVHTAPYDDTDTVELAFIEGLLNGQAGQVIANAHPAGLPYLYSLAVRHLKTRNSEKIAMYLNTLSEQLGGFNIEDPRLYNAKSQGAEGGGTGNASTAGKASLGTQGTQAGAIQSAGGTTNDNQPKGYNQPTGEQ